MYQKQFEELGRVDTSRSFVNINSVNVLKNFTFPRRIEMQNMEKAVEIDDETSCINTPFDCEYKAPKTNQWSLIAIYHMNMSFSVSDILEGLHEVVGDSYFLPIGYTRDKNIDYFVIRNQNDALKEMLKNRLTIQVCGWKLPMIVKLEVSSCVEGQIRPKRILGMYIQRKIRDSTSFGMLDLSSFANEPEFADMKVSLRNRGISKMFFDELNSIKQARSPSFRILNLSRNTITTLENFKKLNNFKNFGSLDLSENNITDIKEFEYLNDLDLTELNITGNACNNYPNLEDKLGQMLPTLQKVNGKTIFSAQMSMQINCQNGNKEISNLLDGILIKTSNAHTFRNRFDKLVNENYWHQVILHHNKRYTAQEIMKELCINLLKDVHFYPCYFKRVENQDEFFLYRNSDALRQMYKSGLKIQMTQSSFTIEVSLRLNVAEYKDGQVNWGLKIKEALRKRLNNNVLDLNDFPRDPEFAKLVVLMNSNATMDFIMTTARNFNPNIEKLTIENCNLSKCSGLNANLFTFSSLVSLSLRNNSIKSLQDFNNYAGFIKEIILDGNPICFQSSIDYIKQARERFENVIYLDGHKLFPHVPIVLFQNFLVNNNLYMVTSVFVDHFFHQWDSFERYKLTKFMYNYSSIFTLSFYYDYRVDDHTDNHFAKIHPRVQNFVKYSRNLAKLANLSATSSNVFIGPNIANLFNNMNRTKHDFSLMTVDVPFFNKKDQKLGITVSGVFEEFISESNSNPLVCSFSRTFLIKIIDGNYVITNDQLLIREPTAAQLESLEKRSKIVTKSYIQDNCKHLLPTEFEQQILKVEIMHRLTELSKSNCKKLLHNSAWDLKTAIESFINKLERNQS